MKAQCKIATTFLLLTFVVGLYAGGAGEKTSNGGLTTVETWDFTPGGTVQLEVHTGGNIRIEAWEKNLVELTITKRGKNPELITINTQATSDQIRATARLVRNARGHSVDMTARVPKTVVLELNSAGGNFIITGVSGQISGSTMGGNITLRDVNLDGSVTTMGGNITMNGVGGSIKAKTMGGNIDYSGTSADSISSEASVPAILETMGGNITINSAFRTIEVKTMGGNINVGSAAQSVKATTMGGNINLKQVSGPADISTLGGRITIGTALDKLNAKTEGGNIEVEKSGPDAFLKTRGGSITVRETQGSLEAATEGGNINVTVVKNLSYNADITLYQTRSARKDYRIISQLDLARFEDPVPAGSDLQRILRAQARQGSATYPVSLSAVNGDITFAEKL